MISFTKRLFTLLVLFCLSGIVVAQGQKIEEGFDYRILPIAQPLESKGKVEVIEFFGTAVRIAMTLNQSLLAG